MALRHTCGVLYWCECKKSEDALFAGLDDCTLVGQPEVAFGEALVAHSRHLAEVGLSLWPDKTSCYIHPDFRTSEYHRLRTKQRTGFVTFLRILWELLLFNSIILWSV